MKTWGVLLLILVLPLIVIGGVIAAGLNLTNEREVFGFAVLVFIVGTAATTVAASARKID